jgi:hypothetical protein
LRSFVSLSSSFVACALVALATLVACGSADSLSAFEDTSDGGANATGGGENTPTEFLADSAPPPADSYRSSPLCRVTAKTCNPDDDGTADGGTSVACWVAPAPDSGVTTTDAKACRLSGPTSDPACGPANAEHGDGAKCDEGKDCAPGFDCIAGDGMGVCRRYCCSGTCASNRSQSGGDTFCDVQKLQKTGDKAPVCMPLKTCKLFEQGECADNETCAIVTESGGTGCVSNGGARVGESCDTDHCNVGLTCLGQPGSRTCYQLCRTKESSACGTTQTCQTASIFNDPTIGVCK